MCRWLVLLTLDRLPGQARARGRKAATVNYDSQFWIALVMRQCPRPSPKALFYSLRCQVRYQTPIESSMTLTYHTTPTHTILMAA